jgi:hypothetical protein
VRGFVAGIFVGVAATVAWQLLIDYASRPWTELDELYPREYMTNG